MPRQLQYPFVGRPVHLFFQLLIILNWLFQGNCTDHIVIYYLPSLFAFESLNLAFNKVRFLFIILCLVSKSNLLNDIHQSNVLLLRNVINYVLY